MANEAAFVLVVGHGPALENEDGAATHLRQLGAHVRTADFWADVGGDARDARAVVVEAGDRPDIAVAALRRLRREERFAHVPAIVALAERQVAGLDPGCGFDDFIVLPYRPAELYARIRRLEWTNSEFVTEERLKIGALVIDRAAHEVTLSGRRVPMTAKEFALLAFLAAHRGKVFGRAALLGRVWGARYEGGPRTVDIHVRRLRAKLGDALPLETLRGAGYKLRAPDETPADMDVSEAEAPLAKTASIARRAPVQGLRR